MGDFSSAHSFFSLLLTLFPSFAVSRVRDVFAHEQAFPFARGLLLATVIAEVRRSLEQETAKTLQEVGSDSSSLFFFASAREIILSLLASCPAFW